MAQFSLNNKILLNKKKERERERERKDFKKDNFQNKKKETTTTKQPLLNILFVLLLAYSMFHQKNKK